LIFDFVFFYICGLIIKIFCHSCQKTGDGSSGPARASCTTQKSDGLSPRGRSPPVGRKAKKGKPARKSAAVTITLLPTEEGEEKISMAEVMKRTVGRVDLAALNIDYLRPKRAKTGGLISEIPKIVPPGRTR
jgi:hypothetical protein